MKNASKRKMQTADVVIRGGKVVKDREGQAPRPATAADRRRSKS